MKSENATQAFPLAMAGVGEWVKIAGVTGGKNLIKRLIAMGLIENTELQVLQRQRGTGLIVACGETRLALGIGMANKIKVVPKSGEFQL
ncbi:MAG TPA: ferrous iron transport protein A [Thioploca sp.]|nr:ferrous iron transport protein A [Thioploca sp.]